MPITVLDPTGQSDSPSIRLAAALPSLHGSVVGLLDNGKAEFRRYSVVASKLSAR